MSHWEDLRRLSNKTIIELEIKGTLNTNMDHEKFGKIINDVKPDPELEELEAKIKAAENARNDLSISLPVSIYGRLEKAASFNGYASVSDYCVAIPEKSLETNVGAPQIKSRTLDGPRVTGPSKRFGDTNPTTRREYATE